jgi:hypothetical protein
MIVRRGLLRILCRQALPATLFGALGLSAYTLLWPELMKMYDFWPVLLVVLHCLLLALLLGRFTSPAFAFIYSRGYTRDALWGHILLASALSILAGWLPAVLIVWTGLRSVVHDHLFQSPYFPIMAPCETWVPLAWLALYPLLASAFHYAWIRSAHPSRGGRGGYYVLPVLYVGVAMSSDIVPFLPRYAGWLLGISYVVVMVAAVLGGRTLHRNLEVRA